jgi:hypothetical protein
LRPARQAEGREHVVEEAPRLPHERLAPRVFLGARGLADEEPLRVLVTHAGHGFVARAAQPAGRARVDVGGEGPPVELRDAGAAIRGLWLARRRLALLRGRGAKAPARQQAQFGEDVVGACGHVSLA